jgi:hypothetical protein
MAVIITPEELYFGAPTTLTYGGTECGATIDAPKVTITPTTYTPKFQSAKGPIKGTDIVTEVLVAAEFTVNQITAAKLAWGLPGVTSTGGTGPQTITWTPGRIASGAYLPLVLIGPGLDGRTMTVTITNAVSVNPIEIDFSNTAVAGMKVKFEGRYDPTTPTLAPFSIVLT